MKKCAELEISGVIGVDPITFTLDNRHIHVSSVTPDSSFPQCGSQSLLVLAGFEPSQTRTSFTTFFPGSIREGYPAKINPLPSPLIRGSVSLTLNQTRNASVLRHNVAGEPTRITSVFRVHYPTRPVLALASSPEDYVSASPTLINQTDDGAESKYAPDRQNCTIRSHSPVCPTSKVGHKPSKACCSHTSKRSTYSTRCTRGNPTV